MGLRSKSNNKLSSKAPAPAKTNFFGRSSSGDAMNAIDRQASKVSALQRKGKRAEAAAASDTLGKMENEYGRRFGR